MTNDQTPRTKDQPQPAICSLPVIRSVGHCDLASLIPKPPRSTQNHKLKNCLLITVN